MVHKYFEINKEGHNIRCKIYMTENKTIRDLKKVVIFGHGFGGHKDNKAAEKFAERLISKHKEFGLITFNWPCHGDDVKKKLCFSDCEEYLGLVTHYVKTEIKSDKLYGYATSFGGFMFMRYIADFGNPFVKLSLRCPAIKFYDTITKSIMKKGDLEILEKGRDVEVGFDRKVNVSREFLDEARAKDISGLDFIDYAEDIIIMHGTKDEVVPYRDSMEFAENNVIELIPIENADHRFMDPLKMESAIKIIMEQFTGHN